MMVDIIFGSTFNGHTGSVYALAESWKEGYFFSGGSDGLVVEWNLYNGLVGNVLAKIPDVIFCMHVDKNRRIIYVGTQKGYLFSIQLDSGAIPRQIQFHTGPIFAISSYQDNLFVISGDGLVSQFNKEHLIFINAIKIGPVGLRSFFMDEFNGQLFIGDRQGTIYSYKFNIGEVNKLTQIESKKTIFNLYFNSKTNRLFVGGMDAQLHYFNMINDERTQHSISAHWYTINVIVSLKPYPMIITGSRDRTIRIWDENTLELLKEISTTKYPAHTHSVNNLLWMEKEKVLLSASDDKTIKSWIIKQL